jgi:hypothetical protein
MLKNKATTPKLMRLLPLCSVVSFFFASVLFFYLNPKAFQKINDINLLQYNLQGVSYTFIMSLFAYVVPSILMIFYYIFYLLKFRKLSPEITILILASTLLLALGSVSTAPEFRTRTMALLIASWLFPILSCLAFLIIAIKIRQKSKKLFILNAVLFFYIFYEIPFKSLVLIDVDINYNIPIILCVLWYTSCNKTFSAFTQDNSANQ